MVTNNRYQLLESTPDPHVLQTPESSTSVVETSKKINERPEIIETKKNSNTITNDELFAIQVI